MYALCIKSTLLTLFSSIHVFKNVCLQMARIRGFNASLEKLTGKLREIVEEIMKTVAFRVRFISCTQYWFVTFD